MICIRRRHHRENAPARARLTLADLSTPAYYGYLPSINLVYVLPLLAIVAGFVVTLGARKLKEEEGRILKLLAGLMMLGLGFVMLLAAEALTNPFPPSWSALAVTALLAGLAGRLDLLSRRAG